MPHNIDYDNVKKLISMEHTMQAVKVSSKFQVVIPREVREAMAIQPGTGCRSSGTRIASS